MPIKDYLHCLPPYQTDYNPLCQISDTQRQNEQYPSDDNIISSLDNISELFGKDFIKTKEEQYFKSPSKIPKKSMNHTDEDLLEKSNYNLTEEVNDPLSSFLTRHVTCRTLLDRVGYFKHTRDDVIASIHSIWQYCLKVDESNLKNSNNNVEKLLDNFILDTPIRPQVVEKEEVTTSSSDDKLQLQCEVYKSQINNANPELLKVSELLNDLLTLLMRNRSLWIDFQAVKKFSDFCSAMNFLIHLPTLSVEEFHLILHYQTLNNCFLNENKINLNTNNPDVLKSFVIDLLTKNFGGKWPRISNFDLFKYNQKCKLLTPVSHLNNLLKFKQKPISDQVQEKELHENLTSIAHRAIKLPCLAHISEDEKINVKTRKMKLNYNVFYESESDIVYDDFLIKIDEKKLPVMDVSSAKEWLHFNRDSTEYQSIIHKDKNVGKNYVDPMDVKCLQNILFQFDKNYQVNSLKTKKKEKKDRNDNGNNLISSKGKHFDGKKNTTGGKIKNDGMVEQVFTINKFQIPDLNYDSLFRCKITVNDNFYYPSTELLLLDKDENNYIILPRYKYCSDKPFTNLSLEIMKKDNTVTKLTFSNLEKKDINNPKLHRMKDVKNNNNNLELVLDHEKDSKKNISVQNIKHVSAVVGFYPIKEIQFIDHRNEITKYAFEKDASSDEYKVTVTPKKPLTSSYFRCLLNSGAYSHWIPVNQKKGTMNMLFFTPGNEENPLDVEVDLTIQIVKGIQNPWLIKHDTKKHELTPYEETIINDPLINNSHYNKTENLTKKTMRITEKLPQKLPPISKKGMPYGGNDKRVATVQFADGTEQFGELNKNVNIDSSSLTSQETSNTRVVRSKYNVKSIPTVLNNKPSNVSHYLKKEEETSNGSSQSSATPRISPLHNIYKRVRNKAKKYNK